MATVQMPDGQLVELPDDADDALKEKIRQKVESLRANQPKPQGGSPTPTPAPPVAAVERTGETGFVFQPRSGMQTDVEEARQFVEHPDQPAIPIPRVPQQQGSLAQIFGGAANVGASLIEGLESPQNIAMLPILPFRPAQAALGGVMLKGAAEEAASAFEPNLTLQQRIERGGGAAATAVMGGLALKEPIASIRPKLSDAFKPLFREPESPTPLSDAATKEAENASEITSGAGLDLREQGTSVGKETSLRQQGEIAPTRQEIPTEPAAQVGVAGQQVAPESVKASDQKFNTQTLQWEPKTERDYIFDAQELRSGVINGLSRLGVDASKTDLPDLSQFSSGKDYFYAMREADSKMKSSGANLAGFVLNPENTVEKATEIAKPVATTEPPAAKLLPGETQGDLLSSTQQEPLQLVGEKGVDYGAIQKAEETAKADRAESEKGQATFEDLGAQLTKEDEARLKDEYEKGLLADLEEHQQRGGRELLDAVKSLGGLHLDEPHFNDLKEAFQKKAGFSKLASGEEGYRYKDIFKKNAPGADALVQALRQEGFDVENPGHLADMLDTRFKTGKKVYGVEARAQEGGISGLEGYALGAAGTKEIPIRGWKEMLESGEQTPVETADSIARAKGQIGKVVDSVGGAFRNLRDFLTVNPIPKLERAGLGDAAYEHASARNSVVHSVRHLLSRVFPDEYKNPAAMQRTGDILTKDNILGVYDQAKARQDAAEAGTPEHEAASEAVNKIEEAHNLAAYDRDVSDAANDPKVSKNIERWKTWVNPEMDRMYNEIKSLDPWTIQESRGRHFGARINLLPLNQAADLAKFTDMSHGMPDLVTSNYRNPNIKADPFMRRAAGTGQYSTDPGLILTNSLARRYNEVTKLRFYNAVEKTGNGFIADAGVRPADTEGLARLAIKMPETNPATGLTRPVEKSLWIKNDLAREARDVLNTDMSAPSNPVFKALTQLQLLQLADATAHMKNIHTVVANSLGASKPWQDAVRKLPFLATADTVGRIASVVHEVAADTPAIRDEIAQMAKQGMIRPQYPSTGIQKVTKMQDAIHHVDTASRIVMNRFWDNLVERGLVTDTPAARRQFVQRIGEYNGRLMGHFSRALRNYGASPFIVAGRTFNAFSKRLLLGDPGFKAASPQAAALARSYQLTGLALATTLPAIINYAITGSFGGRPGTPIGAVDTGTNNEKGDKKIIDLFQLMGIRRGLRATGLGAVTEGVREGKSFNEIGGKAIEDITSTASHPWIGPGLGALYSGISGKRLDLRGGAWPYAAKQVKEGGLKQYGENLRVTLKNQNPLLYGLMSPLVGETEDTYGQGLARGLLKAPASAVGYIEKPGDSAFSSKREKQSSGVKVKP